MVSAGPVPALHGARRQVDDLAVQAVRADVDDPRCRHVPGEVPGADQAAPDRRGSGRSEQRLQPLGSQRPVDQASGCRSCRCNAGDLPSAIPDPSHDQWRPRGARADRHGLRDASASSSVCDGASSGRWTRVTAPRPVVGHRGQIPAARDAAAHRVPDLDLAAARRRRPVAARHAVPSISSASPRPVAASHCPISPCRPLPGVVGQIIAATVKLSSSRSRRWSRHAGLGAGVDRLRRPGYRPSIALATGSHLNPGPSGLASPWIIRTISAR